MSIFIPLLAITSGIDIIEILFFATIIYFFSRWLAQDCLQLVLWFYGYCGIAFAASLLHAETMYIVMFTYGPVVVMLCMLMHQKMLQKNFITFKQTPLPPHHQQDWIALLMHLMLHTQKARKILHIIIEREQHLALLINAPFILNNAINAHYLNIILESPLYDQQKLLWLNRHGTLISFNCTFHEEQTNSLIERARIITQKTDALFIACCPLKDFTFITQEIMLEHGKAPRILQLLKHYTLYENRKNIHARMEKNTFQQTSP